MNISEAAKRAGLPTKTIRYYEDIGLVEPARRLVTGCLPPVVSPPPR